MLVYGLSVASIVLLYLQPKYYGAAGDNKIMLKV